MNTHNTHKLTFAALAAMAVASIAVPGAAFAQVQIPEVEIPEIPQVEDEVCLPPPACFLPGTDVCILVCYPLG